jgi:hypothetical protein
MTNLIHLRGGSIVHSTQDIHEELKKHEEVANLGSPLLSLVLNWLKEDYNVRSGAKKSNLVNERDVYKSANMRANGDKFYNYWQVQ